jgi:hypothetical protein
LLPAIYFSLGHPADLFLFSGHQFFFQVVYEGTGLSGQHAKIVSRAAILAFTRWQIDENLCGLSAMRESSVQSVIEVRSDGAATQGSYCPGQEVAALAAFSTAYVPINFSGFLYQIGMVNPFRSFNQRLDTQIGNRCQSNDSE